MTTFMFGADPEVFVREARSTRGVSAFGMTEGTKESPLTTDFGAVQVDGMALEFNTKPVSQNNFSRFNENIVKALAEIKKIAGKHRIAIQPVMDFDPAYLASQPEEAKELGCDPDYSAYTMQANPRPDGERPFRTGAGHIHIGWGADIPVDNEEHHEICATFVKTLDATVGIYMTMIDREPRRRELYGKAGAYRAKPYGVEYRTPSNAWLTSVTRRHVMWHLMNYAVTQQTYYSGDLNRIFGSYGFTTPGFADMVKKLTPEGIQSIIDTGNIELARPLFEKLIVNAGIGSQVQRRILADIAKLDVEAEEAATTEVAAAE